MKRRLGQHFLFEKNVLKKIIDCSGIGPDDTVVEIGAGYGTLTILLTERTKKVIALEIDRKLISKLNSSLEKIRNVEIIEANALKFPYENLGERFKVVANIPYYITTPLIFRLLECRGKISTMTLLLQKEIAQRIIASPGGKDYGVLSITVQLYTKPESKFTVSRRAFSPPPDVDSEVVHFEVFHRPRFEIKDVDFFLKVVKTAFSHRRKTLLNSLRSFQGIKEAFTVAGIDSQLRPETLSINDFIKLSDALR
ncbi:MAG: ribosomal RNA small subunit methyltransferase A [Nitrospiraceae bacterium]|nr:MAG: ribosomal RNA small subunit methyltransferase A [Nitrospiraceae bacterium]